MRRLLQGLIICLMIIGILVPVQGEPATKGDAKTIAENWVILVIEKTGDWNGSETAQVKEIQEFKRGERVIGYFCPVDQGGYIVVSLLKELAPVKAYSENDFLDPGSDEGMVDIIKGGMERILDEIEEQLGPLDSVKSGDLDEILEINYRGSWEELEGDMEKNKADMNYHEGEVLLSSDWYQTPPYNDDCPNMGCSWYPCYSNTNALVGCVATAGAQIMRYWNWPPYGSGSPYNDYYDWPNMPDSFSGCTWPQAQVDAVAELNAEIGNAVGMSYGCEGSSAYTYDMEDVYEDHYRYSTSCVKRDRDDYSAVDWFNRMKNQFNANRPVQYRIPKHSIVGDGWRETGSTPLREYHMNYGWTGTSYDTWYTLDALHGGDPDEEYMLENIRPAQAMGSWLIGTYVRESFPYRYFDMDTRGSVAIFKAGQYLQFLPDITVTCISTTGNSIRFEGSGSYNTRLFSRGDRYKGVRIYDGTIKLNEDGSIKFG